MLAYKQNESYMEWLIVISLLGNTFIPPLRLPGYVVQVAAATAPIVLTLSMAYARRGQARVWWGVWLVGFMGISVLASTFWSYTVLGVPPDASDFVESYKYLQFVPYLFAVQFVDAARLEKILRKCIPVAAAVVIVAGLIEIASPGHGGLVVSTLYGASVAQDASMQQGNRLFLTGTDPNIGGGIGVFFLFYYGMSFFNRKRVLYAAFICAFLILIVFTQSRTTLVGILFACVLYGAIYARANVFMRIIVLSMIVCIGYFIIKKFDLTYIIDGLQQVGAGTNGSVNVRLENIAQAVDWFKQSPWFGWGPAKSVHDTIIDSEYALILERYGVLGVLIFGSFIIRYAMSSIRCAKFTRTYSVLPACGLLYIFYGMVFMVTNNLFSGYQLMAIIILFLCVVQSKLRQVDLQRGKSGAAQAPARMIFKGAA